jgi:signal transduction histidine kinase
MEDTLAARPRHDLGVDVTLRRVVVLFRVLAWVWMISLVIVALVTDTGVDDAVMLGTAGLATVWTGVTVWAARVRVLGASTFVILDGLVALSIGAASSVAGAEDLFHAGMPMSWILVAAYAYGLWGAVPASLLLAVEQVVVHLVDDRGLSGAFGSLVFPVFAIVLGVAFAAVRSREALEKRLAAETQKHELQRERAELANRLHDSVLQTLHVIRTEADDPQQVRHLARSQERELRRVIDEYRSPYVHSFRAALLALTDDVEDTYPRIQVDAVVRVDAELTKALEAVVGATREALFNAAKHSGAPQVDLYAEPVGDDVAVFVRDRGRGFPAPSHHPSSGGGGLAHSIVERIRAAGGRATVDSSPGEGTEVTIRMQAGQ